MTAKVVEGMQVKVRKDNHQSCWRRTTWDEMGERRKPSRRRSTWGASAGLRDGEFLMRRATITAGLPGKDGRLGEGLRQKATGLEMG